MGGVEEKGGVEERESEEGEKRWREEGERGEIG